MDAEDAGPGLVPVAKPVLEAMQHGKFALGDGALHLDPLSQPASSKLGVVDENRLPLQPHNLHRRAAVAAARKALTVDLPLHPRVA